jgi:hypothetical protein
MMRHPPFGGCDSTLMRDSVLSKIFIKRIIKLRRWFRMWSPAVATHGRGKFRSGGGTA